MNGRILVTGGAGFIGSHLVDAIVHRDWRAVVLDDFSHGHESNLEHHRGSPCVQVIEADVRDRRAMEAAADGCDTIVHLAARKIPRFGNRLETLDVNAVGTANVLAVAADRGARVVFGSTSDCFGLNAEVPFSEESASVLGASRVARWAYAVSKLHGEHLCWAYHEERGVPITILRYFGTYGPREHRTWWGGPQSAFIEALLDDTELDIYGDGTQTRSFSFISDTIAGTLAALECPSAVGDIFNIGSVEEIRIIDLATMIHDLVGRSAPFRARFIPYDQIADRPYDDPLRRKPDLAKARSVLGYAPRVGLREGLMATIDWHRAMRA